MSISLTVTDNELRQLETHSSRMTESVSAHDSRDLYFAEQAVLRISQDSQPNAMISGETFGNDQCQVSDDSQKWLDGQALLSQG